MSDNAANYQQIALDEQLTAVRTASENGNWTAVDNALVKARELATDNRTFKKQLTAVEKESQQFRREAVEQLLTAVGQQINDTDSLNEGEVNQMLDQARAILPDDRRISQLRQQFADALVYQREKQAHAAALQQCQALWDREQGMVKAVSATGDILETCFRSAVRLAQEAAANYPDSALIRGLVRQTEIAYNRARTRYEARTTAEETGDFKSLIESLREEKDKNKLIPWRNLKGEEQEPIPVSEALSEAEILAVNYAEQKAQQYMEEARQFMANHTPRAAKEVLTRINGLFMLDDESREIANHYLKNTAEPEIKELEKAEKKMQQVVTADSAETGWQLVGEALEIYPHVPNVAEARQSLLPRLADTVERHLRSGRNALRQDEIQAALTSADAAVRLSDIVVQHSADLGLLELEQHGRSLQTEAQELQTQSQQEDKLMRDLAAMAEEITNLLEDQPGTAVNRWNDVVEQYGDATIERFPTLRKLRQDVTTVGGIQMLTARLDSAFGSNNRTRLEHALKDVEADIAKAENADFRPQLVALQQKLQLRHDYLLALEVLHSSGDAETALTLFSRVAGQKDHPDADAAKVEATRIRDNKAFEAEVAQAVQAATDHLAAKPPRGRQAYRALEPYKDKVSTLRRQADELLRQAQGTWTTQLVADVEKELRGNNPKPDELDRLVAALKKLPEPRPTNILNQAQATAAERRARRHERSNEWSEALKQWEIALDFDALNPDYKLGKQRARKKTAEIELAKLKGDEAIKAFFETLENDLPLDPEVRFWRAQHYAERAVKRGLSTKEKRENYALAEDALTAARETLSRVDEPDRVLRGKVSDLQNEVTAADDLARQQQAVERKLTDPARRSQQEVERAQQDARRLVTDYKRNTAVADWWQQTRDHAIEQLVNADAALAQDEIWERFAIRSKILVLNPDHVLAQLFVRDLPNRAEDMNTRIERLVNDREGHQLNELDDERIVEAQLLAGEATQADARAIYDRLQGFKEQIPGYLEIHANTLRTGLEQLNSFLGELESLRQFKAKANAFLNQAKVDGSWQNFDTIMRQINTSGFNSHRTTLALRGKQQAIQTRRNDLHKLQHELVVAAEAERFARALRTISVLETDYELGDPQDEYGLRTNIRVTDPVTKDPITNWRVLKNWLTDRQQQLDHVADWLMQVGLVTVLDEKEVAHPPLADDHPDRIVNWPPIREHIIKLTEMGNFDGAEDELHQAVAGECVVEPDEEETADSENCPRSGWYDRERKVLALQEGVNRLRKPPVTPEQANSQRVRALLKAANTQLENLLPHLAQADRNSATINKKRRDWTDAYGALELAVRELGDLKNGMLSRWRNKDGIASARQKVYEALQVCSAIAPYHPLLADVRGNPLLHD